MPNLTPDGVEEVKAALVKIGRGDLAEKLTFPMTNFHPCWPAMDAIERVSNWASDQELRHAHYVISWNMLGLD